MLSYGGSIYTTKPVDPDDWDEDDWDRQCDYADIPERIRRTGRLDLAEELWTPDSGDSLLAFVHRHGDYNWYGQYHGSRDPLDTRDARRVAAQQARDEAEKRQRQLEREARQESQWQIAGAKTWWGRHNARYFSQSYHEIIVHVAGTVDGVPLHAGQRYWVPDSVYQAIKNAPGVTVP